MIPESVSVSYKSGQLVVVLTFSKLNDAGHLSVNYSVRSHNPQPVAVLLRAQSVWQSWVSSIVDGVVPPLPKGWQLHDGEQEAATSRTPNQLH
jgi:hypothetical protein